MGEEKGFELFRGGTISGPKHRRTGTPNQDAYNYSYYPELNNLRIGVVADGAGSKRKAKEGAELAVEYSLEYTKQAIRSGLPLLEALDVALGLTVNKLKELEDYKDYGATLALGVRNDNEYAVVLVGDAFAILSDMEEGTLDLIQPIKRSIYPNVTTFLTSNDFETISASGEIGDGRILFLCSDGVEYGGIQNDDPYPNFWLPISKGLLEGTEEDIFDKFLAHMDSVDKLNDDTTILALL